MTNESVLADSVSRIVLFGGSSVLTSYLPEPTRHHVVLAQLLKEAYPQQKIEIENRADNGEFVARYLMTGTYERHRQNQQGIDVAIIRFGANDEKRMSAGEYHEHLLKFVALLENDFPGLAIVMETGIYLDYPQHYAEDRNVVLNPYWEVSREIATRFNYPLVDYYAVTQRETAAGNWDIRVRQRTGQDFILDDNQDAGKENDPRWFTDIHPNPLGAKIAVREEVRVLKTTYPEQLPTGQLTRIREALDETYYGKYLKFTRDRFVVADKANPDHLQQATK